MEDSRRRQGRMRRGRSALRRGTGLVLLVAVMTWSAACSGGSRSPAGPGGGDVSEAAAVPTASPTESSAASPTGPAGPTRAPELTPLLASVMYAPVPFEGSDGDTHLVYELEVTNFTQGEVTIDGLEVLDASTGDPVQTLGRRAVRSRLQPAGSRDSAGTLGPSQAATLFVHVTMPATDEVPADLTHELTATVEVAPPGANPVTERVAATTVDERTLPVLGPPLSGEGIIAADACCDATRHTRAILPIDGELFVSQRYAIDYEKIDDDGRIYVGDRLDPSSYVIYGDEVIAAAGGTVVAMINDLPEQTPGTFPENIPLDEADGNSVVVDIGDGFFANYAHMQPGSVRVEVGDEVRRGDVLGLVGNSGNTVAPHLHFHVMDGPSPLAAQGLPYLIDSFTVGEQTRSTEAFDKAEADGTPLVTVPSGDGRSHTDQLVLDQRIVTFEAAR
ncbi:MAG: M23 family metallopeptidase [Nocardioidaceae bacterium]